MGHGKSRPKRKIYNYNYILIEHVFNYVKKQDTSKQIAKTLYPKEL